MKVIYIDTEKELILGSYPIYSSEDLKKIEGHVTNLIQDGSYNSIKKILISKPDIEVLDYTEEIILEKHGPRFATPVSQKKGARA